MGSEMCIRDRGIPVSVGVGETKTLSKIAGSIAKKISKNYFILDSKIKTKKILNETPIKDVWGLGNKYSKFLTSNGIITAGNLINTNRNWILNKTNINILRTREELKGISCYRLSSIVEPRKTIRVSRSFKKDIKNLEKTIHKAFEVATTGRPGPVLVDIPKDVQFQKTSYTKFVKQKKLNDKVHNQFSKNDIDELIKLMNKASKPIFYTGGGVINSGPKASELLRELVNTTGFPITTTLQGLGSYPGEDSQFLGMLGMHGSYEANNAMHDCDLMINIGARFDDRITGKIDEFSPKSKKVHIDIDPSSINKNVKVDLPIVGDVAEVIASTCLLYTSPSPRDS